MSNKKEKLLENATVFEPPMLVTIQGDELLNKPFEPIAWTQPGLLPEGLAIVAGPSKIGKSWLSLEIALSVVTGKPLFTADGPLKGEVLYLALEDNQRRLKSRLEKLNTDGSLSGLHFSTDIPRCDEGGLEALISYLDGHPETRLIIVDTFQKFRAVAQSGRETYASDYAALTPLQKLALERRITILLIHHTRKTVDASDAFNNISGTTALMGAADCIWLLDRTRGKADCKLSITGRDIGDQELALSFEQDSCTWQMLGGFHEIASSNEEAEVLELVGDGTITPKELQEALEITYGAAKQRLSRMAKKGKLIPYGRGQYSKPADVQCGESPFEPPQSEKVTPIHRKGRVSLEY